MAAIWQTGCVLVKTGRSTPRHQILAFIELFTGPGLQLGQDKPCSWASRLWGLGGLGAPPPQQCGFHGRHLQAAQSAGLLGPQGIRTLASDVRQGLLGGGYVSPDPANAPAFSDHLELGGVWPCGGRFTSAEITLLFLQSLAIRAL